ncbi:hypothetical protein [Shewanella sp. NFH-SH190041]|nr:hypothetical protein [Shewanella sp. NFH-SH190041]
MKHVRALVPALSGVRQLGVICSQGVHPIFPIAMVSPALLQEIA